MKIKFLFTALLFLFYTFSVYAQTVSLEEINRNIRSEEAELKKLQTEKVSITKQISVLSSKISNYRMLISELNKEKKRCESNISSIRSNIVKVSKEIDENKKDIAKSNMYVIDNMGYSDIKIITTSEKPEDTVKILEILGKAGINLRLKVDKLNEDVKTLKNLKVEEEARVLELASLEESRNSAVKELQAEKNRYNSMVTMIKHDEAGRKEYIELLKFQRKELDEQIRLQAEKDANAVPIAQRENNADTNQGRIKTFGEDKPVATAMADNSPFGRLVKNLPVPVKGKIIEQYGEHIVADAGVKIMHKGIKISPESTTQAKAVAEGRVVFADNVKNFNNLVIIDHGSSYYTVYGNMDTLLVESGKKVSQGDVLGDIIVDRAVEAPYLYFELRKKEQALNPNLWFKKG